MHWAIKICIKINGFNLNLLTLRPTMNMVWIHLDSNIYSQLTFVVVVVVVDLICVTELVLFFNPLHNAHCKSCRMSKLWIFLLLSSESFCCHHLQTHFKFIMSSNTTCEPRASEFHVPLKCFINWARKVFGRALSESALGNLVSRNLDRS